MDIDSKSSRDSDSIPPKTTAQVFTLSCSLLRPAIAAAKLSTDQAIEIGRMEVEYLKRPECLVAAKRATKIAQRKFGCRCTAVTKEIDPPAQGASAPVFGNQLR